MPTNRLAAQSVRAAVVRSVALALACLICYELITQSCAPVASGRGVCHIGADGNLFYKGFFNLLLGLYRYVSGGEKWSNPFTVVGDGPNTFSYTHSSINQLLTRQWAARREGCHCENTKIWPY